MSMMTIALSKGRILDQLLPLLERVDIVVQEDPHSSRKLVLNTNKENIKCLIVRSADVPTYVQFGAADLGMVGKDSLIEHGGEGLSELLDLEIAKCRLMTATPEQREPNYQAGQRIRVATKFVKSARRFYQSRGITAELIKLGGSLELAPLVGLADEIVDLVETGNTLKANNLVARELICDISCRLIANVASLRTKHKQIEELSQQLADALGQAS